MSWPLCAAAAIFAFAAIAFDVIGPLCLTYAVIAAGVPPSITEVRIIKGDSSYRVHL